MQRWWPARPPKSRRAAAAERRCCIARAAAGGRANDALAPFVNGLITLWKCTPCEPILQLPEVAYNYSLAHCAMQSARGQASCRLRAAISKCRSQAAARRALAHLLLRAAAVATKQSNLQPHKTMPACVHARLHAQQAEGAARRRSRGRHAAARSSGGSEGAERPEVGCRARSKRRRPPASCSQMKQGKESMAGQGQDLVFDRGKAGRGPTVNNKY